MGGTAMRISVGYLRGKKLRLMLSSEEEARKLIKKLKELGLEVDEVSISRCG